MKSIFNLSLSSSMIFAFLMLGGCAANNSSSGQFYGVTAQDAAACRLQVAQAMGPPSESLSGTLDQLGPSRALMRDCLTAKGYVAK